MPKLIATLKNGKQVVSDECPYVQAVMWRTRILKGEILNLPTKNGLIRVDGRSVSFAAIDEYILLTTTEAALCMMMEPHVHYKNEKGETFQFSETTGDFEKAEARGQDSVSWKISALPNSTWSRIGKDSIVNSLMVV